MSPHLWIALTIPVGLVSAFLLARSIGALVRVVRGSVVLTVPVDTLQNLPIAEPGPYQLGVEGRRFSRDFGGMGFELHSPQGGLVPLHRMLARTSVSSFSRSRLTLQSFDAGEVGTYRLSVRGIRPDQDPDNRIVLSRPMGGAMVGLILAIIATAALTIGSLVGTVLLLVLPGRAAR